MKGLARASTHAPPSAARGVTPIDALSVAARGFDKRVDSHHIGNRRSALHVGIALSLACGLAVAFAAPFEFPCAAILAIRGDGSLSSLGQVRKELLDYVWSRKIVEGDAAIPNEQWRVDSPEGSQIRLTLLTSDRARGVATARRIATEFLDHLEHGAAATRAVPSEAEAVLHRSLTELAEHMDEAKKQVEIAVESLPSSDPRVQRDGLAAQWDSLRGEFDEARGHVRDAVESLAQIESAPPPSHGVVSASERTRAMDEDDSLRQDLRELGLRLSEVRAHVLRHGGESLAALDRLEEAERAFDEVVARAREAPLPATMRAGVHELGRRAERYGQALTSFSRQWRDRLSALRSAPVDPLNGEILDFHERMRTAASEFLFAGAEGIPAMRKLIAGLSDLQVDGARFPILESDAVRAAHGLQAAHHRLEFAAAFIDSADDFRLDAALRGARGLRRRTQERIRTIEQRLESEAAARARRQREDDLRLAETLVRQARQTADDSIGRLVELQIRLNSAAAQGETFHEALRRLEAATSRLDAHRGHHDATESRLRAMEADRRRAEFAPPVELVSCGVSGYPVNLFERVKFGGIAGSLSLFAVLAGYWTRNRGSV